MADELSALEQHLRRLDQVLGFDLFGGGEAVEASSAKIMTKRYAVDRTKKDMPEPCKARKGNERKGGAEDVALLINVLTNRNCGCEIHDIGCFAAIAQSFGFHTTRIIIDQRLLRYSNPSDYVKKSQSNLEETLRRLINLQQHKLVPRFSPDQNGLLVCREVFLYLMHVPASTYTKVLLKISDTNAPARDWHKKLARQLADRGPVAANQIRWLRSLRNKIEQVAQNPPNHVVAKALEMYMPLLVTAIIFIASDNHIS